MAVAIKASAEVELVERLCRSLGIDPAGVDELTIAFKVGERAVIRVRRLSWDQDDHMMVSEIERHNVVTVERR